MILGMRYIMNIKTKVQNQLPLITGRQCLNRYCDGPEWWAFFDESPPEYRECPFCGYPCTVEVLPEKDITAEEICFAVLADSMGREINDSIKVDI